MIYEGAGDDFLNPEGTSREARHAGFASFDQQFGKVAEAYIRLGLTEIFFLTLDIQYLDDRYDPGAGDDVDGWIGGVRLAAEF